MHAGVSVIVSMVLGRRFYNHAGRVIIGWTHSFAHAGLVTTSHRQSVPVLRNDVYRRNPRVIREVITLWHRFVGINIELFAVVLCRFQQEFQIRSGVGFRREPQPH